MNNRWNNRTAVSGAVRTWQVGRGRRASLVTSYGDGRLTSIPIVRAKNGSLKSIAPAFDLVMPSVVPKGFKPW